MMPLVQSVIETKIFGALASTRLQMTYCNVDTQDTLECTFKFALEKTSTVATIYVKIDDRTIETRVADL